MSKGPTARWGPSSLSGPVSGTVGVFPGSGQLPEGGSDLLHDLPEHRPRDVYVPSAHPGRSPGLPSHDRVDHDIQDAEDQEYGRLCVTSVMRPPLPNARIPKKPLPDMEVRVRAQRSTASGSSRPSGRMDRPHSRARPWAEARSSGYGRIPRQVDVFPVEPERQGDHQPVPAKRQWDRTRTVSGSGNGWPASTARSRVRASLWSARSWRRSPGVSARAAAERMASVRSWVAQARCAPSCP